MVKYCCLLTGALLYLSGTVSAQKKDYMPVAEENYKICNWKDNKSAAVVLTFDDWTPGHPAIVVPQLQKRGMVGTFNIITSTVKDWAPLREAAKAGNEMANHTATHPYVNSSFLYQKEVFDAKNKIEKEIGSPVFTFAYPFGAFYDSLIVCLKKSGHIAARGVYAPSSDESYSFYFLGKDYYNTYAYGMKTETTIDEFVSQIENVVKNGGLLTYLYHSVYNGKVKDFSYAWVLDSDFSLQLDTLASYKDKVWITTYADAIKYHKEAVCAQLFETRSAYYAKRIFVLKDNLDNKVYDQPLTIILNVGNIKTYGVSQNSVNLPFKYISDSEIQFEAVPDSGEILIDQGM